METTVYVHLTEERGYYLPFRAGEPATVSETNTAAGAIFIAVATWIAQFIAEVSSAIDRGWRTRPYISARVICAHGDLSPAAAASAKQQHRLSGGSAATACDRSFIAARSEVVASRPMAMVVYLHFAATIRRVVGCGWGTRPSPPRHYVARIQRSVALSTS